MSRHEQARAILEALFQRRPPSEGISEARLELYRSGNAYYFRPRVVNKTQ